MGRLRKTNKDEAFQYRYLISFELHSEYRKPIYTQKTTTKLNKLLPSSCRIVDTNVSIFTKSKGRRPIAGGTKETIETKPARLSLTGIQKNIITFKVIMTHPVGCKPPKSVLKSKFKAELVSVFGSKSVRYLDVIDDPDKIDDFIHGYAMDELQYTQNKKHYRGLSIPKKVKTYLKSFNSIGIPDIIPGVHIVGLKNSEGFFCWYNVERATKEAVWILSTTGQLQEIRLLHRTVWVYAPYFEDILVMPVNTYKMRSSATYYEEAATTYQNDLLEEKEEALKKLENKIDW